MQAGTGSYRAVMSEMLRKFNEEIDSDILEKIQIHLIAELQFQQKQGCTDLLKIYSCILENQNNYKDLVLKMIDVVLSYIKDYRNNTQLAEMMSDFKRRMTHDSSSLMLEESQLFGRSDDLETVNACLVKSEHNKIKLINVWGISGVGKSHFIKHVAIRLLNRGEVTVVYVSLRNVTTLDDLLCKVLQRMEIKVHPCATPAELTGQLFAALRTRMNPQSEDGFVLMLDDVSRLMATAETGQLLFLLHQIITQSSKYNMQLKIIVTSCERLLLVDGAEEFSAKNYKQKMEEYAREVMLGILPYKDAQSFSMPKLSEEDWQSLLSLPKCHSYALSLFEKLALDSQDFLKREMDNLQCYSVCYLMQQIMQKAFDSLTYCQKKILLFMALVDGEVTLETVCMIVDGPHADLNGCYNRVQHDFNRHIWLNFTISDMELESVGKIMVTINHPIIAHFLQDVLKGYKERNADKQLYMEIRRAYIDHYLSLLIRVGKDYEDNPESSYDDVVKERANIRRVMGLLAEDCSCKLLFEQRSEDDIAALFLFIHVFYKSFSNSLLAMLKALCKTGERSLFSSLSWSLYILVLTVEQDKTELKLALKQDLQDLKHISRLKNLHNLCRGIYSFAEGTLSNQREDFQNAVRRVRKAKECQARDYFYGHFQLAEAQLVSNSDAAELYKKAQQCAKKMRTLEPLVLASKAAYECDNGYISRGLDLIRNACKCYKEHKHLSLDRNQVADCLYKKADILLKSVSHLSPSDSDVVERLNEAKEAACQAYTIRADNSLISRSKEQLLLSCVQIAELCQGMGWSTALEYYREAYSIVDEYGEDCNLSSNQVLVDKLLSISTHLASEQLIDKVTSLLRAVYNQSNQQPDSGFGRILVGDVSTLPLRTADTSRELSNADTEHTGDSDNLDDGAGPAKRRRLI